MWSLSRVVCCLGRESGFVILVLSYDIPSCLWKVPSLAGPCGVSSKRNTRDFTQVLESGMWSHLVSAVWGVLLIDYSSKGGALPKGAQTSTTGPALATGN